MAMGNCPKYLHVRDLVREEGPAPMKPPVEVSRRMPILRGTEINLGCCGFFCLVPHHRLAKKVSSCFA